MAMIAKFSSFVDSIDYVRDRYNTSSDRHKLSEEELQEILGYKNISKDFVYHDWYGSDTKITVTLKSVERDGWKLIFTMEINKPIHAHYVPAPFQVLEHRGLLFPVGVTCLTR